MAMPCLFSAAANCAGVILFCSAMWVMALLRSASLTLMPAALARCSCTRIEISCSSA